MILLISHSLAISNGWPTSWHLSADVPGAHEPVEDGVQGGETIVACVVPTIVRDVAVVRTVAHIRVQLPARKVLYPCSRTVVRWRAGGNASGRTRVGSRVRPPGTDFPWSSSRREARCGRFSWSGPRSWLNIRVERRNLRCAGMARCLAGGWPLGHLHYWTSDWDIRAYPVLLGFDRSGRASNFLSRRWSTSRSRVLRPDCCPLTTLRGGPTGLDMWKQL